MPSPYVDYKHGREDAERGFNPKWPDDNDYMTGYRHGISDQTKTDNDYMTGYRHGISDQTKTDNFFAAVFSRLPSISA